jgi:hypothetical protein
MDRPNAFNPEKNQDSQGDLKDSQSIQTVSSKPVIAELDVEKIQPFQPIPDYTSPTISPVPIVVISPTACSCIDGWDLIQSAKSTGCSTIACYAFYIPEYCETEIAIRKVAVRTMPQGGTCSYAELVRNAGILFKMLLASTENPIVFSHGGLRRGAGYTESKENNIRMLLANRLDKSVTTISKYLNHAEFLNAEALETLIIAGAEKEFFEAAQPYKRKIITDLKSTQKADAEISEAVSEAMLFLLHEYQATKKAALTYNQTNQNENLSSEIQNQPDLANWSASKPKRFIHWSGNSSAAEDNLATEDDIGREIKAVGSELMKVIDNKDLTAHQIAKIVSSQIVRLAKLIQQLKNLDNLNTEKTEDNKNG